MLKYKVPHVIHKDKIVPMSEYNMGKYVAKSGCKILSASTQRRFIEYEWGKDVVSNLGIAIARLIGSR